MLYIKDSLTQQEIAEKVGVSRQTVARWAKEEKWEEHKVGVTLTREQQIANLHRQVAEINKVIASREDGQRYANAAEADTINKLSAAIAKMEGDYGIADIISVSKQILFWLRKRDPQKAIELSYYFDEFVKEKLR